MGVYELRHDAPERTVLIVIVLELLELRHQRVPAALGDADREHDEERVQARLLDDDAVLGEVLRDDGRGDARLREIARYVEARRDDRALDRVEHVEARRQLAEAVPALVGTEN